MEFTLHPQLQKDTDIIGEFPLCLVLLIKDSAVPWVVLVPKKAEIKELHHLPMTDQQQFLVESQMVSQALEQCFKPDKLNLGALGNMVPQLHIHHIARFKTDIAWPGPVWGNTNGERRTDEAQQRMLTTIRHALTSHSIFQAQVSE